MKHLLTLALSLFLLTGPGAFAGDYLKGKVLKINLSDGVSEREDNSISLSLSGLSASSSVSLLQIERALRKAADDDRIAMVFLNLDHFQAGMAALEEIRTCLGEFSKSGKPVVAYAASLGNGSYYLGSVADRIFMHPQGEGSLTGLGSTQFFLKDLLDKLEIEVQLIRHGKFKSAGEMYIRNDISPENRRQYEELLESIWSGFVDEMAQSRGLRSETIRQMADQLTLSTAKTWLDNSLVDGLKYRDEMEQYICRLFGTTDPKDIKSVSIQDYIGKIRKGSSSKKIAVIYADGEIVRESGDIVGEKLAHKIAAVRADSTVKAVVFRVNSPGGEVVAADMIRREIELLMKDKPVVASYGEYAASGGYLISAGCRRIFTDNATLTGSIGVFGMVPSFGKAIKKNLHVTPVQIGTNAHSGMSQGIAPLSEEELAWYQQEIEGIYDTFVGVVANGRSMTKEAVDEIAQGRVWSGKDALRLGLADEKGTILDAIDYAASLIGKKGAEDYRLVCYPEVKSIRETLFGNDKKDKDEPLVRLRKMLHPGLNTLARMPYLTIDETIVY